MSVAFGYAGWGPRPVGSRGVGTPEMNGHSDQSAGTAKFPQSASN